MTLLAAVTILTPASSAIDLKRSHMLRLALPGLWLQDSTIECYGALLQKRWMDVHDKDPEGCWRSSLHIFNSFFVQKIIECEEQTLLVSCRRFYFTRNKKVDVLKADSALFMPFNRDNIHWSLLVLIVDTVNGTRQAVFKHYCSLGWQLPPHYKRRLQTWIEVKIPTPATLTYILCII
mmetsp:Transcript_8016/g.14160  ORF Transcript_8016/g.14160 Transcript_8016/m.14160 type:complete len:178 (+) Transcript_8016:133-666(+)